ncbi:MAG: FecR family protein, partial [Rikenellaceae bacterium]
MKSKDQSNYNKSKKIAEEIVRAMNHSIIKEEANDLRTFLETNKYAQQFTQKICDEEKFAAIHSELEKQRTEKKLESFLQKLDTQTPKRRKLTFIRSIAAVSAAAALLAISVLFYNYEREVKNSVAENIDKPMLILNDGSRIDLEQVNESSIGEMVISKMDNKISYVADNQKEIKYNRLIIPKKYSYTIVLSDGSEVCLNAGSELKYPENFGGDAREVTLNGEAYFKVTKSKIPFVVKVNNVRVKVYGTEFNINNLYSNTIETTLVSGSVGVKTEENEEVIIKPNQMISVNKSTNESVVSEVDVENYISWKNGNFHYTDYSFTDVINDITVWYGVTIKLSDAVSKRNLRATLSISREISLEETF